MDFAKNLSQWRDQPPDQWIAQVNRVLPPIAIAVVVILIAVRGADLTWQLLESPARQDPVPPAIPAATGGAGSSQTANLAALDGWRPFGDPPSTEAGTVTAKEVLEAPPTSLNLTLNGVVQVQELPEPGSVVTSEAGVGAATISDNRGNQETYRTGEAIKDASGTTLATLFAVYADRVLLDLGDHLETLSFPAKGSASTVTRTPPRLTASPQRTTSAVTRASAAGQPSPAAIRESVTSLASTLAQHVQLVAASENGRTIGYTLRPRGDGQVFAQLGLEPGDVLTEVNRLRFSDVSNTSQILQALGQSPQASVTIRRNGVEQTMTLDMSQLEQLSQSLQ